MPEENEEREKARRIAFRITGVFEAPSYSTVQTQDSGIISYGLHQATLASGTLSIILNRYCDSSDSETAGELRNFLERAAAKDATLKTDGRFLDLLRAAGNEQKMKDAQDSIFVERYWNPAAERAIAENLKSPLGFAVFYDTNVQGGLDSCVQRTRAKLENNPAATERQYIKTFLESRRERLLEIYERDKDSADPVKRRNAEWLRNSARTRVGSLISLVDANNLGLTGRFDINGTIVEGLADDDGNVVTVLQEGDNNEAVGVLQDRLVGLGYMTTADIGANRGRFGPKTSAAVKAFQADLGLAENGIFAAVEQEALNAVFAGLSRTRQNETVTRKIQDAFVGLGYMTTAEIGSAHGTFGQKTENAVKHFQADKGIGQDGVFGPNTFKALFNAAAGGDTAVVNGKPTVNRRFSEINDPAGNHYRVNVSSAGIVRVTEGFLVVGPHSPKNGIRAILGDGTLRSIPNGSRINLGIDYVIEEDLRRRVKEWFGGRVVDTIHSSTGYGNRVIVRTNLTYNYNGANHAVFTHYAHLDSISVSAGQNINAGDFIGVMGNTGGSHGAHVDQRFWIEAGGKIDLSPNLLVVVLP